MSWGSQGSARIAAGLFTLLVVTGCANAGPEPAPPGTPQPKATSASSEHPASLDDVIAALTRTEAITGTTVEKIVMDFGPIGDFSQIYEGAFDGPAASYRAEMSFEASSDEVAQIFTKGRMELMDLKATYMQFDDAAYLTMHAWPPHLRGRWLKITEETLSEQAAASGFAFALDSATPSKLLPLIELADEKVTATSNPDDGTTYQLTVPARDAVSALGNAAMRLLGDRDIDSTELTGAVPFKVTVDGEGRVVDARLDATEVTAQLMKYADVAMPPGFTHFVELDISDYGKPVTVKAPPKSKLIDPSEMN